MKTLKKLSAICLSVVMVCLMASPTSAFASTVPVAHDIYYTVYNEYGEIVEEGLIPVSYDARYSWSGTITLKNGWQTSFTKPNQEAFYVTNNTRMKFSYELDRNANIECVFGKSDTYQIGLYPTIWKTVTKTAQQATISVNSDETTYYFVAVTNMSSDPITISDVSFVF